jgi:MFS family permease
MPFLSAFLKHVLVNPDGSPNNNLIMLIFTFLPYIGLVANPASAIISDKFRLGKHIISFNCFIGGFLAIGLAQSAEPWAVIWGIRVKFLVILPLMLFSAFFLHPLHTLLDAETMRFLNKHSSREKYGSIRLLGTVGWSVACIVIGWLVTVTQREAIIYYGSAVGYFLLGFATLKGLHVKPVSEAIKIPWKHLKADRMFQWVLVFIFFNGIISMACFNYMAYFFDDVTKSYFRMGLIFGTWTIFEIPVMIYSHKLISRMGNRWFIVVGMTLNAIRLFLFSQFTLATPFLWKFTVALIQGPAFAFTFNGFIDFIDRQAHDDMRATYLALANIARFTIAGSLAGLLGGIVINIWGTAALMQVGSYSFVGLVVFFLVFVRGHGPERK